MEAVSWPFHDLLFYNLFILFMQVLYEYFISILQKKNLKFDYFHLLVFLLVDLAMHLGCDNQGSILGSHIHCIVQRVFKVYFRICTFLGKEKSMLHTNLLSIKSRNCITL